MTAGINHGRYVCGTCECVFHAALKPIIIKQPGKELASAAWATRFVQGVKDHFDPYWFGSQGITTRDFLAGLLEYAEWRHKHKCHRVRTLRHTEREPAGYSKERLAEPAKAQ